jgi:hypothetical protein
MTAEYSQTSSKIVRRGRGMAQGSIDLIDAMREIAETVQPVTGRGVGYKLFAADLIPSMSINNMQRVYRRLREARERGLIPWEWIVDETRSLERKAAWSDREDFVRDAIAQYRRDFWDQQPDRVEVWSEKGTIRGVLRPVLDAYGVGFRVMHGFGGATTVHDIAQDNDDSRPLIALYVGDFDPSGMFMSECDLPNRMARYGGEHVEICRIALIDHDVGGLSSFPASDKSKDPRHAWFVENYGNQCWELDAMDPNALRERVKNEITALIEPEAWAQCMQVNKAEQESLQTFLSQWGA